MDIVPKLMLIFFLILVNAFFSCAEIAIFSVNKNKILALVENGDKRAKLLLKMIESPSKLLSTIQVAITLANFFASASAAISLSNKLEHSLTNLPYARELSVVIVTLILSYLSLVLGELVPKRIGLQKSLGISLSLVGILNVFSIIFTPLIFILTVSTNAMVFILGFSKNKESDDLSKEEMIAVLNNGNLEKPEKEMMENIIDFDELLAREVMIPRPNIFAIQKNETIESLLNKKNITTYSRVPVYDEDLDDVIGILHIKDLLLLQDKSVTAESLMKEAYFVPDTKKVSQLFMEMKTNNNHMAILIDEYGGVSGIVTLEDLLEELVGDITDEYDKKIYNIVEIGKNKYLVNGDLSINDLNDFLKTDFYSEHYDSVGGLVIEHIGYIPDDNANIDDIYIDGACFKVLKVKNKKIQKVLIKKDAQSN